MAARERPVPRAGGRAALSGAARAPGRPRAGDPVGRRFDADRHVRPGHPAARPRRDRLVRRGGTRRRRLQPRQRAGSRGAGPAHGPARADPRAARRGPGPPAGARGAGDRRAGRGGADLGARALCAVRRRDLPAGSRRDALAVGRAGRGRPASARPPTRWSRSSSRSRWSPRPRSSPRSSRPARPRSPCSPPPRSEPGAAAGLHDDLRLAALARVAPRRRLAGPARRTRDAHGVRRARGLRHGGRDRAGRRARLRRRARARPRSAACCWRRSRRAASSAGWSTARAPGRARRRAGWPCCCSASAPRSPCWRSPGREVALAALLVLSGLLLAPTTVIGSTLLDTVAPSGTVTEAFTVMVMAIVVGTAVGNAVGGSIVESASYESAVLLAGVRGRRRRGAHAGPAPDPRRGVSGGIGRPAAESAISRSRRRCAGLLALGADDPVGRGPPVGRRLRLEPLPRAARRP